MTFVLRMAIREARASWRRLVFFFICVALGVGAIVALRSVIQTVRDGLAREARALTASDVLVRARNELPEADAKRLDDIYWRFGATVRTDAIETATMVRPADATKAVARMVELQGVESAWPLYGAVALENGQPYSHALLAGAGALVRPELLTQLGVAVGDEIVIGEVTFTIRGVILEEPGRQVGFFSFGPRVLVDLQDLRRTGLLTFGSRARYVTMLKVPELLIQPLVREVERQFERRYVSARSYRGNEDRIGEDLERAENYLSLVGFIIVVLGGIGVWSVTRVFIRQKIKSIAVLKCVGATSAQVLAVYLAQILLLGLAGSVLGVGLAAIALALVPAEATAALRGLRPAPTLSASLQGVGVGLLVSLLFSLVPLLDVRRVRPLLLLRDEAGANGETRRRATWRARLATADWPKIVAATAVTAGLLAIASWQAGSLRVGALVCGGFVAVAVVLHLAGGLLVRAVQPLTRVTWFPLRHAVISFDRPGNQTRVILMAVGLGAFFIIGVRALQVNLLREFSFDVRTGGPDLFLIDIQQDQAQGVQQFLSQTTGGAETKLIPVLRARVTGVDGERVRLDRYEEVRGQGSLGREYVVTYRPQLEANERVIAGRFWTAAAPAEPEVSIEDSIRERFGIDVGDRVRFDVLGRPIAATVTSVRQVEWNDMRAGGFMFVFSPGVFDRAPQTYIAVLRGPEAPVERARLQRDLVVRYPNVSAIDVREVARTIETVLSHVTLAISIVGAVAIVSGVLILVGSVAMTKFQRLRDAAIFKTLGASSRTLATMLALEYGTLGALAGTVGSIAAIGLSWVVCRLLLDISWRPAVGVSVAGLLVTAISVGVVGVLASLDVLRRRPLATLRAE
jgi:putative ABC transport system permease protein